MPQFKTILTTIEKAIERFNKKIPASQRAMLDEIESELRRLDLNGDKIKATVDNLKIVNSIKNKLQRLIITDDYKIEVREFIKAFGQITKLQNEYWKSIEAEFKPRPLLREIRKSAIIDTVKALGEQGIGAAIGEQIAGILRTNITAGGSMKALTAQLRQSLTDTKTPGLLSKYAKQITTDAINGYSAQYTQVVSGDLGFEFFAYQGTEIKSSRPFCQSMVEERRYFHISEVPALLRADDMYYTDNKDGKRKKVPIYEKTKLPHGFIEGTNPENFFIRRAGHQCGHQIRPVSATLVKSQDPATYERVINSAAYKRWKSVN